MSSPFGMAFFCEDIREELGGKVSYMGIFGQDMVIQGAKPALMPKLSIAAHVNIPRTKQNTVLRIVVTRTTGELIENLIEMQGEIERPDNAPPDDDRYTQAIVHLNAVPFQIADDCEVSVRAFIAKEELWLGTLPIRFASVANQDTTT